MNLRVRILAVACFVAMLLFAAGGTALAGRNWCATDPILVFADGTRLQWLTQFPADSLVSLTGPVTYTFAVPANAGRIVVLFPSGAAPERVKISYSAAAWDGRRGMPVRASVRVPASASFKTATTVSGNVAKVTTFVGSSNTDVDASVVVDPTSWNPFLVDTPVLAAYVVSTDTTIDVD